MPHSPGPMVAPISLRWGLLNSALRNIYIYYGLWKSKWNSLSSLKTYRARGTGVSLISNPTRIIRKICQKDLPVFLVMSIRLWSGRETEKSTSLKVDRPATRRNSFIDEISYWRLIGLGICVGSQYWRFDPQQKPPIKSTYPKDISNWEGLPNNLDAAFQFTNGYSYFFKNGQYWRFNDRSFKVKLQVQLADEAIFSVCRPGVGPISKHHKAFCLIGSPQKGVSYGG